MTGTPRPALLLGGAAGPAPSREIRNHLRRRMRPGRHGGRPPAFGREAYNQPWPGSTSQVPFSEVHRVIR